MVSKLKYNIHNFFYWGWFPIYINLNIFKCWKYWRKVKDYFIKPDVKFRFIKNDPPYPFAINKWLSIEAHKLNWKLKFEDYCYEDNPWFGIALFNKFYWVWELKEPMKYVYAKTDYGHSSLYWEAILQKNFGRYSYVKNKYIPMKIYDVYKDNIWTNGFHKPPLKFTIAPYLTEYAYEKLKREITKDGLLPGKELFGQRRLDIMA